MKAFLRAVLITLGIAVPLQAQSGMFWTIEESQLDIPHGGRVNTIAVHPHEKKQMFVASETGGLFKTVDGGLLWQHVDKLPVIFTQSVAYLPSNPKIVFVSAKADFKAGNGGGVWRSENGGEDWVQVLKDSPDASHRMSAYGISFNGDTVYVGTSRGLALGWEGGTVWGTMPVFTSGDFNVLSVLVKDQRVYVGGREGIRVMTTPAPGTTPAWDIPMSSPGAVDDIHAFGGSPLNRQAFVVNENNELWVTENGGANWRNLSSAPKGVAGCSGTAFIKALLQTVETGSFLQLYFSNGCDLHSAPAPIDANGVVHYPAHAADWVKANVDHDDPRDLGVTTTSAVLLGTTGGLHRGVATNTWRFVGGGRTGGYNALQINEVKGQRVGGRKADLYIGTQDNNLWAWSLEDNSLTSRESEAHHIELPREVDSSSDCKMTFALNNARFKSGRLLANMAPWADAPSDRMQAPALIRESHYVQNVMRTQRFLVPGLAWTDDCGDEWETFAVFYQEPRDLPRLASAGDLFDPLSPVVMYQPFRSNAAGTDWAEASGLMRIWKPISSNGPATVFYPAMKSFGGLGINLTHFGGYRVYGVDSRDPLHIIAPDVVEPRLMRSNDGGESWSEMSVELRDLVTDDGRLLLTTDLQGRNVGKVFPIVTAISFSPQDPRLVLMGTSEGGIFASTDRGEHWAKVPGSQQATYVTSFYWDNANTVYVSTYGRGLWKLRNRRTALPFDDVCTKCDVVSIDGDSGRPPFDGSVLAFDGRILGVRTEKSQLREVFVTPGTSVLFTGDPDDPQDAIIVTESDGRDSFEPLPQPKERALVGVVFTSDEKLIGTVLSKAALTLFPAEPVKETKGSTDSPTKGTPYISLISATFDGIATAAPQEALAISATGFAAGASYEVLVGELPVKGTFTADSSGAFTVRFTAPTDPGYHRVEVRPAGEDTVIDGTTFVVQYRN
ncbi:MAG TPA: hypothetical protein VGF69_02530 [Thermoanaerobaculia bacterium]